MFSVSSSFLLIAFLTFNSNLENKKYNIWCESGYVFFSVAMEASSSSLVAEVFWNISHRFAEQPSKRSILAYLQHNKLLWDGYCLNRSDTVYCIWPVSICWIIGGKEKSAESSFNFLISSINLFTFWCCNDRNVLLDSRTSFSGI